MRAGKRQVGPAGQTGPADVCGAAETGPAESSGLGEAERPDGGSEAARVSRRTDPVAWLIALAAFVAYGTLSVFKYLRLEPGSWDLGIFTEYVKQLAHLRAPVVAIRGAGFNLLGDHFQPIVALIAPFFRLFPSPVTLLIAQALLTALSVVPVCRAAQELLGTGASRAIGLAYGFSWGLQQMINFDFHEIAFAVPLLAFSLSAILRRRPLAAVAWALPLVFVKEDQGFTVAAIGLLMTVIAVDRARRRWAPAGLVLVLALQSRPSVPVLGGWRRDRPGRPRFAGDVGAPACQRWPEEDLDRVHGAAADGVSRAPLPARRCCGTRLAAALPLHEQLLLGSELALQRHRDARCVSRRD